MKKTLCWMIGAGLAMGGAALAAQYDHGHEDHEHAEVGNAAPAFELKDANGKTHSLEDYEGKVVVLEWTNHECPVVNRVHNQKKIEETIAEFDGKPVAWIAINSSHFAEDKKDEIRTWLKEQKIEYPMLLDADGKVGHMYQAKTTPHMFVIDKEGVLIYQGALDNDPYGKADDVRNYVVEAVTATLEGSTVATKQTKPYGCTVKYKS